MQTPSGPRENAEARPAQLPRGPVLTTEFTNQNQGFRNTTARPRLPEPLLVHGAVVFPRNVRLEDELEDWNDPSLP